MHLTARQVASVIWGAEIVGDPYATAERVDPLWAARPGSLSWLKPGRGIEARVDLSILIAAPGASAPATAIVECENPRLGLAYVLKKFFAARFREPVIKRDLTALVHPTAVIGEPGMAYEWDERINEQVLLPHIAGVVIGPRADIGPVACVMRGLLQDTVIKAGAKIGNHATIGHGALVGIDAIVCPHAVLGGSSSIGTRAFIGIGAIVRPGANVGHFATVGQGANVVCDVPAGETWHGNPARRTQ